MGKKLISRAISADKKVSDCSQVILKRRKLMILIGIGVTGSLALPSQWSKPIINAVLTPVHAQMSPEPEGCSGFTTEPVNEPISISISDTEITGPFVLNRPNGNSFSDRQISVTGTCQDGQDLVQEVEFNGIIDSGNNQITGDLIIRETCGSDLVCEQITSYTVTQTVESNTTDNGEYDGTLIGTLRCCNDFL